MFGLDYEQPHTVAGFAESYKAAVSRQTPTLIEVKTDREENVALHRRLLEGSTAGLSR